MADVSFIKRERERETKSGGRQKGGSRIINIQQFI